MEFIPKKLNNGEALYPYWGKSFDKITGLDPLGQQNASERIYSHLLPGITNLTNRIRYYGFYCWILWKYEELNEERFNQKEHRIFIRRAEFAASLIMNTVLEGVFQIPGSNKANEILSEKDNNTTLDVSSYADSNKERAYWKYSTGALGQYYVASLRQMGLVKELVSNGNLFYVVTDNNESNLSGKELALVFQNNLDSNSITKFLKVLNTGTLYKRDVKELFKTFNLASVPTKTKEWEIYWSLLNSPNEPSLEKSEEYFRKETIELLKQKSLSDGVKSSEFLDSLTEQGLTSNQNEFNTEFGWFQYRLNEYWQLSCGAFFWAILNILSGEKNGIYLKKKLIQEITEQICSEVHIDSNSAIKQSLNQFNIESVKNNYQKIENGVKAKDSWVVIHSAFQILLKLFSLNEDKLSKYSEIIREKGLNKKGSFLNTLSRFYKEGRLDQPVNQFLYEFIDKEILLRHRIVALNKLGSGSRSTLKFEIEEGRILYDNNFEPSFTNPRVDTLLRILSDMSILKSEDDKYHPDSEFKSSI